jgi:hypothetical protein
MKLFGSMGTIVRDDVKAKFGPCEGCEAWTRSHVLEPAEYEIIKEEVIVASADVYAAEQWEDVEEVERYDMVLDAVVMCHRCWTERQERFAKFVKKRFEDWRDNISTHHNAVKKAINTQIYYDYNDEKTIAALKILAKAIKEASLDGSQ